MTKCVLVPFLVLLSWIATTPAPDAAAQADATVNPNRGVIIIEIPRLRSETGGVLVNLYAGPEGFPNKPGKAAARLYVTPRGRAASASFPALPYGLYAVAVCHDENGNRQCDTNLLGIPKEGVGASNNARGVLGPPSFKDAKFKLEQAAQTIEIELRY